ncbi:MAG: RidA family protein [Synergistaceae bacterium]|jgi:2-iminobutanoate/2-iminopropanoate deaminase|nr:RidA family protein [Synergistaceae bacterium]
MKKIVSTAAAPAALGPYSQAVWAGDFLYCSGQLGINPKTGAMAGPDVISQAVMALENIKALLASQGLSLDNVVKTLVFLTDIGNFKAVNEEYAKYFRDDPPARSCVEVSSLPLGGAVEIEVIAHR